MYIKTDNILTQPSGQSEQLSAIPYENMYLVASLAPQASSRPSPGQ